MTRQQLVYIAGPMTGLPDYNYPAFHLAAKRLRGMGYGVLNPAENPDPLPRDGGEIQWSDWLRVALAQVLRADAIALLPGWEKSPGARLELHVAHKLGLAVYRYDGGLLAPLRTRLAQQSLTTEAS